MAQYDHKNTLITFKMGAQSTVVLMNNLVFCDGIVKLQSCNNKCSRELNYKLPPPKRREEDFMTQPPGSCQDKKT